MLAALSPLHDHGLRVARWQRALAEAPPEGALATVAAILGLCLLSESPAQAAYLSLLTCLDQLGAAQAGVDTLRALREAHIIADPSPLHLLHHAAASCLLVTLPPLRRLASPSAPPPDRDQTLGHKLARAALPTRDPAFERLLLDPAPAVIARLCQNPRLTLQDLLRVAARRPTHAEAQWAIARSPRWLAQPPIRAALALNPYTETTLSLRLLPSLPRADLDAFAATSAHHPALHEAARLLVRCRQHLAA
jgi:hypothetical protein